MDNILTFKNYQLRFQNVRSSLHALKKIILDKRIWKWRQIILVKDSSLNNLISKIEENHPGILRHKEDIQLAVNRNVAGKNLSLKEGDQIAVFPPVAGG